MPSLTNGWNTSARTSTIASTCRARMRPLPRCAAAEETPTPRLSRHACPERPKHEARAAPALHRPKLELASPEPLPSPRTHREASSGRSADRRSDVGRVSLRSRPGLFERTCRSPDLLPRTPLDLQVRLRISVGYDGQERVAPVRRSGPGRMSLACSCCAVCVCDVRRAHPAHISRDGCCVRPLPAVRSSGLVQYT